MRRPPDPTPRILSLGSITADFRVRADASLGGVAAAPGREVHLLGGGKAADVAAVARMLGCDATLLGRVGDDDLASQALQPLHHLGVDLGSVRRVPAQHTAFAFTAVPPAGAMRITLPGGPNLGYEDADIAALCEVIEAANSASLLVVDYEISPRAVSQAVRAAHRRGVRIVVDPSFPQMVDRAALRLADALTPNESDAKALAGVPGRGEAAAAEAAEALAQLGPKVVCIKLEGGGCLLRHQQRTWRVGFQPTAAAFASTGAGDGFSGAFAVALLEGRTVPQAAAFALAASDLVVTRYGSQLSNQSRERLNERLRTGGLARRVPVER